MKSWMAVGPWQATGAQWIAAVENEDAAWRCDFIVSAEEAWARLPEYSAVILLGGETAERLAQRMLDEPPPAPPYIICAGWTHPAGDGSFTLERVPAMAQQVRTWERSGRLPRAAAAQVANCTCLAREALAQLGMPGELRANAFLPDMLALCMVHPPLTEDLARRLYPLVARRHGSTPGRVERSLRLAIEATWDRAPLSALEQFFGHSVDPERGKPTNREFLLRMGAEARQR